MCSVVKVCLVKITFLRKQGLEKWAVGSLHSSHFFFKLDHVQKIGGCRRLQAEDRDKPEERVVTATRWQEQRGEDRLTGQVENSSMNWLFVTSELILVLKKHGLTDIPAVMWSKDESLFYSRPVPLGNGSEGDHSVCDVMEVETTNPWSTMNLSSCKGTSQLY